MTNKTFYAAELISIFYAISLVLKTVRLRPTAATRPEHETTTILYDNASATQAIRDPRNKAGQRTIYAIQQAVSELKARGIPLRFQWIRGHSDDPGNDAADKLSKGAVDPDNMHPFCRLVSQEGVIIRKNIHREWEHEWEISKYGAYLRRTDTELPAIGTRRLYDPLPRTCAITQLRAGHLLAGTLRKAVQVPKR